MNRRAMLLSAFGGVALLSCGKKGGFVEYILVQKGARKMHLYAKGKVVRSYDIALGFEPHGHKQFEGDGKTPEGRYVIDRKNPRSEFHLSLGVSYPNRADFAYALARGKSPGGDIFIHGEPNTREERARGRDWTAGCIAITDKEVEEVYRFVSIGTVIDIRP